MKSRLLLLWVFILALGQLNAQQLIQGTIKNGSTDTQVEIWLKPNFSNSTQYLAQIVLPIAVPASVSPQPTLNVVVDNGFKAAFGDNYPFSVSAAGNNTGNTEKFYTIALLRGGAGSSNPQTWTAGTEFKVLTINFTYPPGPIPSFQAKLADYQDGGSNGQGSFYTADGNANYYVTPNSIGNFYASSGNSIVGGTAAAGYAQIMSAINAGTVSGTSPLCIGAAATYTSNGDPGGTWTSTNTSVATVNATTGFVTAVAAGSTDITYTISGVSAIKTLTVNPNVSAGTVSGGSPLCIGSTSAFSSNGTSGGSWSSGNTSVATVNASTGLVTAVGAGTTDITYTINSGCGSPVSSFASVTVNANVSAGTVIGAAPLCIGATTTYTSNGTAGGVWSSSNTSVATVNASTGVVTATGVGIANIIYTVNTGCGSPVNAFAILNVNPNVSAGAVSGTSPLCIGATATYTSNGTAGGSWTSSNTSVATVNAGTGVVTAIAAGTTNITYTVNTGCGSPASSFATLTINPNVSAGTVSGTSPLCIGATATYTSNGTAGGTWTSSNTSVATVNATTGLVTAANNGTTNITYTVNTGCGSPVSSFSTLTVNPNVSAGTVSGTSPLTIGATDTYTSNGTAGGTWTSSNTSVATVNATTGLVTTVIAGTTNITYTVNTGCGSPVSSFKTLTVNAPTNAGTVSGTSPLCIGATSAYTSSGDAGGSWSSSNTSVATVNANTGFVTAIGSGTTDIIYTINGVSAFKTLTVNPNVLAGTVSGTSPLCIAATATYTSNGTSGGAWSSSNTSVATVNATTGLVTALAAGTTNITYTVNTGCGSPVSSFATLTVNPNVLAGTVTGNSPLCIGTTATYISNGTSGGAWSSSNTAVATVNATTGLVTTVAAGTTNITYTVNSGCGSPFSSFAVLTVNPNVLAGTVSGTSPLTIGATDTYTSNGTAGGAWSSSNTSVATVNATTGLVTALIAGTSNITYTVNTGCGSPVSSLKALTVNAPTNAGTVSGTSPLCIGATSTYTSNGDAGGAWSSSNTSVATVNASTGSVTATGAGTADIIYTVNGVSAFKTLTVNANVSAGTVSGTSPLCIDATATYTSNGNAGGTWISSNTSVATVNATTGLVTVIAAGTANIIYTVNSGCGNPVSASKTVTVNSLPIVAAITGVTTITAGGTSQLSSATAGGVWSSNNTGVATISTGGLVSALSAGSAVISYKVTNGCGTTTVTANITVQPLIASLIQGTIKPGSAANEIEVWLKPSFTNSTQYLAQIVLPIAWPSSSADQPTGLTPVLDPSFTAAFGNNYTVTTSAVANNTGNTEKYFNIAVVREGAGSSTPQSWTEGVEFKVLTATFNPSTSPNTVVKLADYQDGGSNGLGNFYTADGNANYYISSNSVENFYASPGNSTVGGNAAEGYAVTTKTIGCSAPVVSPITGTTSICAGATTLLSSSTAGGAWSSDNTSVATVNASTGLVTAVNAGTAVISYKVTTACGTTTVTATVTVNPATVVSPINGTTTICAGSTTQLTSATTGGTWSSDNTSVATVNASSGLVNAVGTGTAVISYSVTGTCGTTAVSTTVTVNTVPLVAPVTGTTTITVGGVSQLSSTTAGGTWSSNNTSVATVNANTGLVTAVGQGTATISYTVTNTCGPTIVTATVTVQPAIVKLIKGTIKPGSASNEIEVWLKPSFTNSTQYLAQILLPIAWPSSSANQPTGLTAVLDPSFIAAFGNNYIVTTGAIANNTGNTEKYINILVERQGDGASSAQTWTEGVEFKVLTATFNPSTSPNTPVKLADYQDGGSNGVGNFYTADGNANYYITSNSVENFYASPGKSITGGNASAGYAQTINNIGCTSPVVAPITGTTTVCVGATTQLSSTTTGGTWSSNNASATVNANGLVAGISAGTATISYAVTTACGTTTVTTTVTVNANANAGTVSGTTPLCIGSSATYSSNGTPGGTWSSSNPAVASVNANTGVVLALAAGTTSIKYTVTGCSGSVNSSQTLTVNANANAGTVSGTTPLCIGSSATYTSNGTTGGTWSSSNPLVASVNATTGVVLALAAGTTNIVYTVTGCGGSVNSSQTLTVNAGTGGNAGTITGLTPLCTESVVIYTTNGTKGGVWSSTNTAVATVNATTGRVVTLRAGTTNIVYTVTGCIGSVSASKTLTVNAPPSITTTNIVVNAPGNNCSALVSFGNNVSVTNGTNITYKIGSNIITSPRRFDAGNTVVQVFATNSCGTSNSSFIVTVKDTRDPMINCPGNIVTSTPGCSKSITTNKPVYSDNCSITQLRWVMTGATTGKSASSGINFVGTQTFKTGLTTITYTVFDGSENASSCSFTVKVNGTTNCNEALITETKISVLAYPNPSEHHFDLRINTKSNEEVYIKVMDITGRQLQQFKGSAEKVYRFGDGLTGGTYIIEVRQGNERATTRVVKAN